MAGDERRAEVEAVTRALMKRWIDRANAERYIGGPNTSPMVEPEEYDIDDPPEGMEEQARLDAEAAVAALDRLRDARGDDEAGHWECLTDHSGEHDSTCQFVPRSPQDEDHEIRKTPDAMVGLVKGSLDKADKSCHHDSTRIDGTLDCNCLRCGADGYWHDGHRHDRDHPSGKVLFVVDCPQGEDHETPRLAKLADWLERDRREPDKVIAYAQEVRRLSRVSPSRDGTVAVEDVVEAARALRWNVSDPYSDDTAILVEGESWRTFQRALAEFARSATGEQTDHGGDQ